MLRVLLVDDHQAVRAALLTLLTRACDVTVCGQATTSDEAVAVAAQLNPDVVIMDLGDGDVYRGIRRIRNRRPATSVVLLTAASRRDALIASVLGGAAGYLLKQLRGDLLGSIRAAGRGECLLDPAEVAALLDGSFLSPEETRLAQLLVARWTDEEIAAALCLDRSGLGRRVEGLADTFRAARMSSALDASAAL